MPIDISTDYFRQYRQKLGFANQQAAKKFFGAKEVTPTVDLNYIALLNQRLYEIVSKINEAVHSDIKVADLQNFRQENIDNTFEIINNNDILPVLNNQGRRPEQVYFSWMRGYILSNYFLKALSLIFVVDITNIDLIGDDDLKRIDTFKRTPKADLQVKLKNGQVIRIEMQSGFTGINDIKQHKVLEAKRVFSEIGVHTIAIHFDLYNGQVAFIELDQIKDNSVNWITRQQMEGQTVFNIDQNYFVWKITEKPIKYSEFSLS